jgi:hypothetical protein
VAVWPVPQVRLANRAQRWFEALMVGVEELLTKPVTILVGHFGSGKSEIAVNLAYALRQRGDAVVLADVDVVKPYFRCRLVKADLEAKGIELIAPEGDRFFADLPIVVPTMHGAVARANGGQVRTLIDVGGDDSGARVLGSLATVLRPELTDVLFIVNTNRPFAEDLPGLRTMLAEIQTAAGLAVTGLIANTHLLEETDVATIRSGLETTRTLAAATGIPIRFCVALTRIGAQLHEGETVDVPVLAIERHLLPPHVRRRPGSLRSLAV